MLHRQAQQVDYKKRTIFSQNLFPVIECILGVHFAVAIGPFEQVPQSDETMLACKHTTCGSVALDKEEEGGESLHWHTSLQWVSWRGVLEDPA